MIDLAAAIDLVERSAAPLPSRRQRLADARGRALAAPIVADCDSPPFDRAMMDGFAVVDGDFGSASSDEIVELEVAMDLAAGDVTMTAVRPGTCMRIMTGAPLPPGADAVVPVECAMDGTADAHAGGRVRLRDERFRPGQHVGRRGTAFRAGAAVLRSGAVLTPAAVGLAAEAGATHVVVAPRVRVAILSTGSELVPCDAVPAAGQTRNSNGPMLAAACAALDAEPIELGVVPDRPEPLRAAVAQGLAADVLVLSGGVSAGDLDLVPATFSACGVERVFHKVRLKPGKPAWFGILRRAATPPTLVFGLPGNPASSLVCFELFVRPAIRICAGAPREQWHLPRATAQLVAAVKSPPDRPVYLPCRIRRAGVVLEAEPLPWTGSSDILALATADALLALPAGGRHHQPGEQLEVLVLDRG
ncbi:MAG: gephyrin-like molybdotransferase Glp [Planctomycetaceae bacterium]